MNVRRTTRALCALLLALAVASPALSPLELRLDRQLKTWQKRLGLEDWALSLQVVRQTALDRHTWGNAEWDPATRSGVIRVLDPKDYNLKGAAISSWIWNARSSTNWYTFRYRRSRSRRTAPVKRW